MFGELLWEGIKILAPALTGGGATLFIQWLVNKRKINSESNSIDAETEGKSYAIWKQGFQETQEGWQKLLDRVIKVEIELTEAKILVERLKLKNEDLRKKLEHSEKELQQLRMQLEEIVEDGRQGQDNIS